MQALLLFIFVFLMFTASGLAVAHYRRVNRGLSGELLRYSRLEAKLRDSEERYRTLFELAPVGCVVWEPGFKVTEWNDQAARIFGWTRDEMLGRNLNDVVVEEKAVKARRALAGLFIDGKSTPVVIPMVTKDGRAITCEWRNAVLRTPDGRPAKIVSVCTDITRQKAQERELAMLRALVEFTEDPVVSITDPKNKGRFVYVNDATCRHYGLRREELLALSPADMDPSFDASRQDRLVKALADKRTFRFETEHRTASGELVPVKVLLNWFEHDGEAFVAHYVRDIRERRALEAQKIRVEAEAARWESEKRLARLAASAPGLMFTSRLGPDGVVSMPYASAAIRDVFGLEPEAVAESIAPIHAVIHPDDRAHVAATIENSARSQGFCQMEFRVIHPVKGEIWVGAQSMPECQPDGTILWHGFMVDVTDSKRAEALLQAREQEFRTLAETLPDNLIHYDRSCRAIYMNPAMVRAFSLVGPEPLLGLTPTEAFPAWEVIRVYEEVLRRVVAGGGYETLEMPLTGPDDEMHIHHIRFAPTLGDGDEITGVLAIGTDITERKRYEEVVEQRLKMERRLTATAESVPGFIFTLRVDLDGRASFPFASPGIEELFGVRPEAVRENASVLLALYHPDDLPGVITLMESTGRTLEPFRIEIRINHPEKGQRWIEIRSTPHRQPDGATEWHGLMIDITERKQMELRLEQSKREFASLAENLPDNVARWDREGRYLYINPTHARTLGLSAGEVIGSFIPDTHEHVKAAAMQVVATGRPVRLVQQPVPGEGGDIRMYDVSLVPEWDNEGRLVSVLGLGRDMTDIYRIQTSLREQKEFQETLLNAMDEVGVQLMVIENGRLVHVSNRKLTREFGYSDAEVDAAPPLMDIIHPDDRGWITDYHRRRLAGEDVPSSYEVGLVTRDGERREYEVSVAVVPGTDLLRIISVGKDVTQRKRMEDALRRQEQEFRALVEKSPDTIARYDRDCRRVYANPSLEKGIGVQNALGKTPRESQANSPSSIQFQETIGEVLETGRDGEFKLNWRTVDGSERWSHIRLVPEFDSAGRVSSVLAMGRDITDIEDAGRRLGESRALLRKLAVRRESEYEAERKRLAWEVFDTLGQLLMVQRLDVASLRARFNDEKGGLAQHVEKMLGTADKAIQVMRSVAYELRPVILDMGVVFALQWAASEFEKRTGIVCALFVEEEDICLDESGVTMIFRIVQESLDNIARHAEAGHVDVDLKRVGDEYVLEVRDDGRGFDLDTPMEKSLGLLDIQERVHVLGGEMVIFSMPGQGTVLEVRIPAREAVGSQMDLWENA